MHSRCSTVWAALAWFCWLRCTFPCHKSMLAFPSYTKW
jgi:hypothetical protein